MIEFNWHRKNDGAPLTKLRATWTLSREDLAAVLCARLAGAPEAGEGELSRAEVERLIRDQLEANADARYWWRDREEYPGEPTNDDVFEWALRQVGRL
jgi:hypothetical protein